MQRAAHRAWTQKENSFFVGNLVYLLLPRVTLPRLVSLVLLGFQDSSHPQTVVKCQHPGQARGCWWGAGRRLCNLAHRDPLGPHWLLNSSPNFENTKWAGLPGKSKKWDHFCPQPQDLPVTIFRAGESIWKNVRTIHTLEGAWEKDEAF